MQSNNLILLGLANMDVKRKRTPYLFYPNDTWKILGWDVLISIVLLLTCVLTPFDLAFQAETDKMEIYVKFRYAIDIIFGIDILINFNCAT